MSSNTLARISAAKTALLQASTFEDVLDIRDKAASIQVYVRAAGEGLEVQNQAAEIRLRAERRAGEMLAAMADAGTLSKGKCNTLSHLSITRIQSSRWQMEAKLSESVFESIVESCKATQRELTQSLLLAESRKLSSPDAKKTNRKISKKVKLLDLIAEFRQCIAKYAEEFGTENRQSFIAVLKSELSAMEGN